MNLIINTSFIYCNFKEYNEILKSNKPHVLIDVRPASAYQNGSLPNAVSEYS